MKLEIKPILTCTTVEYETNIKPLIDYLENFYACPQDLLLETRATTWRCDDFKDSCSGCPFQEANILVQKAVDMLKDIRIEKS